MRMMCPHCNEHAYTRTSLQLTNTSRETIFQCRNFECGHVFSAVTEINRTISPSAIPNPGVVLPMSTHIKRREVARQMAAMPLSEFNAQQHRCTDAAAQAAQ
ncbi:MULTISPECIES: ogr/Delta-like zinc finger family protein [Delftia]|nr:ogr/Delta-like zinc finger family protein [Delftia tsuruhatensis]MPT02073.1 transcriptional regulator [Pseudomonas sp.]MPT52548.1 transcriptional regulator [Delftia sp.]SFB65064.1 Ogr/Delta-like zinc finger [Delftia tsuruhatensis]